ncbi:MAG: GH3 auxin-responsive promoter [Chloroflexota bacterium]|nr:MAG: GH3 auxin-responsive promoter [Chloroflexota bacterium]HDD61220.1 GH3 auxin-responsive promoter [Chloroflexota bacterium]
MSTLSTLIKQGRKEEIWTKYCGFLDLTMDEFMEIQERLILEQIDVLGKSMMGRMIMGDVIPTSIDEFREVVPLTTYKDYIGYLDIQREDVLPRKPYAWCHTSGRTGEYKFKWVPYTKKMYDRLAEVVVGAMILSSANKKGDINLENKDTILLTTAPPPYFSAIITRTTHEHADVRFLPDLDEGEKMGYVERVQSGFKEAMIKGLDYFYGISSVLVRIGEQFEQGGTGAGLSKDMLKPSFIWRMGKGFLKAKLKGRPMRPMDIWNIKGIMTGGADTAVYSNRIKDYWGRVPVEGYACTEGGLMAIQAWNLEGMTFYPENDFLEFIPNAELKKEEADPTYTPKTVLFNELDLGVYELIFTNFHGGILTRYRVGDLFEVTSMRDDELDINLPQMKYYARSSDVINLANMAFLTEKDIWFAMEKTGLDYNEWIARKVISDDKTYLHLYVEAGSNHGLTEEEFRIKIKQSLQKVNSGVQDLEDMLGYDPLKFNLLNPGAFQSYMEYQKSQGADLAHTKPPHMNPTKEQLGVLIKEKKFKS